ncbi:MAG: beta-glucuronidase [Clostridia bacterium]|nr:beta-glucuronidase [Clostridia bacterium]
MERLFKTHYIREQECLDGVWDFQATSRFGLPEEYSDTMAVPSCWEMNVKYIKYTGCAAYRKTIVTTKDGNLRFVFKGVSHTCKIYLDGSELGGHYSAYSAFSVIAKNVKAGEHTLEVLVDNSYSEKSRLHIPNDYFTYGGITRPVFMEYISDCYIERTEFEPKYKDGKWLAQVRVFVNNISASSVNSSVKIMCAGSEIAVGGGIEPNETGLFSGSMSFDNIKSWSPDSPYLYEVKYTLGEADDLVDRVGFRTIELKNRKIYINGEQVFIKGVNRHEDHGITGCAIPLQIMYSDIALIKDLGANGVRTSHYQNDERFLDLCDENGIMVWEESHDRGGTVERLLHPLFMDQSMNSMHEMLEYHYNHPSIIMWGCLNEGASNAEECVDIYKTHLDYFTKDKSRPHTFASNKHIDDLCLGMVDICSMNMYPHWYHDDDAEWTLNRIKKHIRETGNDDKPLIISEYGAAAIYGFRDPMNVRWSEEYQAEVLRTVTEQLLADDDIAGVFIWQFCDTRIKADASRHMTRARSRNNKGLVDEYRRPKMAYYEVRKILGNCD